MKRTLLLLLWLATAIPAHAAPPSRIIALGWIAAEQLLELGVKPLAVVDRDDYRRWVVRPALPAGVLDAGSRSEPNLELLVGLRPDLMVTDGTLDDLVPRLERIAPVLNLHPFSNRHDNASSARALYLQLAQGLGREAYARQRLLALDARLGQLRARLSTRFPQGVPPVCVIRVGSPTVVWLYGDNSMLLSLNGELLALIILPTAGHCGALTLRSHSGDEAA